MTALVTGMPSGFAVNWRSMTSGVDEPGFAARKTELSLSEAAVRIGQAEQKGNRGESDNGRCRLHFPTEFRRSWWGLWNRHWFETPQVIPSIVAGHPSHRHDEAVADFRQSLDEARVVSRVVERGSQLPNGGVHSVLEINKAIFQPEGRAQLLAGNDVAAGFQQQTQYLQRLFLNRDRIAGFSQFSAAEIDLKTVEARARRR